MTQPEPQFEVLFCDLCSSSVPIQDLEQGKATRQAGKLIGGCCLSVLRGQPAPAAPAATASPTPAAAGDGRWLPVAFLVLVGIAAATIFLESRMGEEVGLLRDELVGLRQATGRQDEALRTLSESLDTAATRDQVATVVDRIEAGEKALQQLQAGSQTAAERQLAEAGDLRRKLDELGRAQPDYRPLFDSLQQQLRQQAVDLAELRALPRAVAEPRPAVATPPVPVTPAPEGLPPALAHQVQRLADPDPATRFEAVDELLRSKDPGVREHLLPLTKDADTFVRRLVVEGLGAFRHASCVEALLTSLADPEEIVRDTAWRSLKDLTGQKLPFEATASRDARARAQAKWVEWWEKNRGSFGA